LKTLSAKLQKRGGSTVELFGDQIRGGRRGGLGGGGSPGRGINGPFKKVFLF